MIEILLLALHVLVCVFLILVVLLQSGQAADLAGAFGGGGSQTALGMRGATTLLHKLTTGAAVVFMLTSLALGLSGRRETSVIEGLDSVPPGQPAGGSEEQAGGATEGGGETSDLRPGLLEEMARRQGLA